MEAIIFTVIVGGLILRRCLKENRKKDAIRLKKEDNGDIH